MTISGKLAKFFGWYDYIPSLQAEVIPGVERPTYTLVGMVAADIFANGYVKTPDTDDVNKSGRWHESDSFGRERRDCPSYWGIKTRVLEFRVSSLRGASDKYRVMQFGPVTLTAQEEELVLDAMKKWDSFSAERRAAEREAKNQQAAIDAIEKFMGVGKFAKSKPKHLCADAGCDGIGTHLLSKESVTGCEFSCCNPEKKRGVARRALSSEFSQEESALLTPERN